MRSKTNLGQPLIFLKLGGSLITEKDKPLTARAEVIARLAREIAAARAQNPELKMLLGHGSGSFGHVVAQQHGTVSGVRSPDEWQGFAEVWHVAAQLNRLVMDKLHQAGLPAIAFPPSATVICTQREIHQWNVQPLVAALEAGLLPVTYGDVVFDRRLGGSILSTEDLFVHLGRILQPKQILLAGVEEGVFADYPARQTLLSEITTKSLERDTPGLTGAKATDVTGGMAEKVRLMLSLVEELPQMEVHIFSAVEPGALQRALTGEPLGTRIRADTTPS
jgi:isopentenyl phosphate kinase